MRVKGVIVFVSLCAAGATAAPKTLVVGAGDCQSVELINGLNDFSGALREKLKSDLYEPDVVLDIVRPRPTRSLEDVERQVESARTLFYNAQHERALDLLKQALAELERAPLVGQPWKVTAQALALQGVVLISLNKKAEAAEAFRRVLRVEPAHALSTDEFTPSVISQFEGFRKELARQKKGVMQVQSAPSGAEVLVEGRVMGVTPLRLELPASVYRLAVRANDRISYLRTITVPRDALLQIDLASEGALVTQAPLCLSARDKVAEAAALKLANTVTADDLLVVKLDGPKGAPGQFVASRYEIRSGSMVREGRVQTPTRGKDAFGALATFLLTGQSSALIVTPEASSMFAAKPVEVAKPVDAPVAPPPSTKPPVEPTVAPGSAIVSAPPSAAGTISAGRVAAFVLMGAGVASVAGGVVAWVRGGTDRARLATLRQSNGKLPEPTDPGHRESLDILTRADLNQTVAFSLLGAGAGFAAAGLVSFFVFPGETVAVTAVPSNSGAAVFVSGSF